LIFAKGVDAAIEVKPNIQDNAEVIRGLKQIQSVKKLKRYNSALSKIDVSELHERVGNHYSDLFVYNEGKN
jgi:hypothetical protein